MDVHKETISIAVMNSAGKLVMESSSKRRRPPFFSLSQGLRGDLHVTFEEGTWAAWLYDLLKPHVTKVMVCNPRRNALLKEGNKSDRIDARKLAELLRNGSSPAGLPWRKGPANAEGAGAQLSDDQQGSHAGDESAQGIVPKLGHCLAPVRRSTHPATVANG